MADPHVIFALREKRALVAGMLEKLERKLEQQRADLTHIDGVFGCSSPTASWRDQTEASLCPAHAILCEE